MSSNIPLHEPVGTDTDNWTSLSNSEAHIRAKAVEKGHTPHDWRHAVNKVFHTDKAYPKDVRETLKNTDDTNVDRDSSATATGSNNFTGSNDFQSNEMRNEQRSTDFSDPAYHHRENAALTGERDASFSQYDQQRMDAPFAGERRQHNAMQDQSNMGRQDLMTAPENAPEMVGDRGRGSQPFVNPNIIA
ncbi:hypothetical protein FRB91_005104 [Serendipita sp. 411]|nr:hypothetical protein FRC15_007132 [Serendipita sp. 397]KAG8768754.1 hypothetical protein FRC16_006922 [Serendipita sp. 398]KAG8804443.1 hypothetical protein FRC18_007115 [Serendipita sp. 400]KAG8833517.1 hypothetical protein FRC20_007661 [Serendipita sp. 405]KAG8841356.1 hypothetical protein FRB91_005104 [Serendipita sp. 411]